MKFLEIICASLVAALLFCSQPAWADSLDMPPAVTSDDLKPNVEQPYIVKPGDTLWDIADHFFKDPFKWIKIWERNLYITNPDLIYPGNKIWFDGRAAGGLRVERLEPRAIAKPVERLEKPIDMSQLLTVLERQDFIQPSEVEGVGHILDSQDQRLNYGRNDNLYLRMNQPANPGDLFDIFRTGDPVRDPHSGEVVGFLVEHLGQVRISSQADGIYRAKVEKAFQEISRGDRLKPAKEIDPRIVPSYPENELAGSVLYIRNNAFEAGQHQVIGISIGQQLGLKPGSALSIFRAGRKIKDQVTGETVTLPEEEIGQALVLVPQQDASIALITKSTEPINIGDSVKNPTYIK